MIIDYHRRFLKHFKLRIISHPSVDRQYEKRVQQFLKDRTHPIFADHALHGDMEGFRSFSVNGDIRVIYRVIGNTLLFYDIGTHNQVYS